MPVKHQHPQYTEFFNKWERCIDVCKGQDAVHKAGTTYLPKLVDQEPTEYENYKTRAVFYNATWRTISGLQGMLFRKPPQVEVDAKIEPMLENINLAGTPLHIFALEVAEECLKLGRVGIFVDFPVVGAFATTADIGPLNLRPSMKLYKATSIINWKTKTINNATVISMVVLKEAVDIPEDEFKDNEGIQYRVLDLMTTPEGEFIYRVRVFIIENENGKEVDKCISTEFPKIDNQHLTSIPFQFIGVDDVSCEVDEPPLIDLVDMNLSHYRSTADYEHGCHFTGLPTPVVTGHDAGNSDDGAPEKFYIGSMSAWVFRNAQAKAFYLEFTGQGLGALQENLTKKEGYMAVIGARMLEAQKKAVESANHAAITHGGEQSMLSSVAQAISIGIEKALKTFCGFAGADDKNVKFSLNRDFFPIPMDALTLTAIIAGWQNGAYSFDTMFANLKKGEIVAVDKTAEEEQKEIAANPPPAQDVPTTPGNVSPKSPKPKETPATPAPTITQLQK